jgi:hypothetical protein
MMNNCADLRPSGNLTGHGLTPALQGCLLALSTFRRTPETNQAATFITRARALTRPPVRWSPHGTAQQATKSKVSLPAHVRKQGLLVLSAVNDRGFIVNA